MVVCASWRCDEIKMMKRNDNVKKMMKKKKKKKKKKKYNGLKKKIVFCTRNSTVFVDVSN